MNPAARRIAMCSIILGLVSGLGGCSRSQPDQPAKPAASAPPPVAEQAPAPPTEAEIHGALMRAVFGKDYRPSKGDALAGAADPHDPGSMVPTVFTPVASTTLPGGETVLVVNGEPADEKGEAQSQKANGGSLNIYLLRETGGNWEVLRRHEHVDDLGHHGRIGQTRWVRQTNGRVLLAVEDGSSGQGYSVTILALFDPAAEKIVNLVGDGILVRSDSDGACVDEAIHCWNAEAKWHTAPSTTGAPYDDLVLIFSGWEEKADPNVQAATAPDAGAGQGAAPAASDQSPQPVQRIRTTLSGAARYVFDNGAYRLKSGKNPIPSP